MSNTTNLAFDELPRGSGGVGATEAISRVLDASGLDVPTSLYDEALALAREGRLAPATERLRMLLVLDPTDGDAALLLGKVLAARNLWQDALTQLDAAAANGAYLPAGLRDTVVNNLRKQIEDAEEHRQRVAARERGEIRNLRSEAKRLRSDNANLEVQVEDLNRRVRIWSSATALVAGSASALLLAAMIFGGSDESTESPDEVAIEDAPVADPSPAEVAPAPAVAAPAPAPAVAAAPVAPAPAAAPAPPPAQGDVPELMAIHKVSKGDTLGKIAKKYYGDSARWPDIQKANADTLGDGISLRIGQKLKIPAK